MTELPLPVAFDPHSLAVAKESGREIRLAVSKLTPDRRRAVEAWMSGLDVSEIQDVFGWPYERARNLLARGRADLRAILQPYQHRVSHSRSARRAA